MAKSTNINNRRYLGNKYKLLPFIKKVVDSECTDIEIVLDIFSGTGAVASAFQDKQLITNDIMYSNYIDVYKRQLVHGSGRFVCQYFVARRQPCAGEIGRAHV